MPAGSKQIAITTQSTASLPLFQPVVQLVLKRNYLLSMQNWTNEYAWTKMIILCF